jgi:hypothetical protein
MLSISVISCFGIGDSLVVVSGKVHDQDGGDYDHCKVSLKLASTDEVLDSRRLEEIYMSDDGFEISFHVHGWWRDCYATVECIDATEAFVGPTIERGYTNPINLALM